MKAHLIFPDKNFDPEQPLCADQEALEKDLGINFILESMANGDELITSVCRGLIFAPLNDPDTLKYRQEALADALEHPSVIRELYGICVEAEELRRKSWNWLTSSYISGTFSAALSYLSIYLNKLGHIKTIADKQVNTFHSRAFSACFRDLQAELNAWIRMDRQHKGRGRRRPAILFRHIRLPDYKDQLIAETV